MTDEPAGLVAPPAPGTVVHVDFRKWGGGRHWQFDGMFLGSDEYGHWLGLPAGTRFQRPGASFAAARCQVVLFPTDRGFAPTFWDREQACDPQQVLVYVDIATVPQWREEDGGVVVSAVDLDLDVVRRVGGEVYIHDEDEFAAHQVELGYPAEVVERARQDCRWVEDAVRTGTEPFGSVGFRWLRDFVPA